MDKNKPHKKYMKKQVTRCPTLTSVKANRAEGQENGSWGGLEVDTLSAKICSISESIDFWRANKS